MLQKMYFIFCLFAVTMMMMMSMRVVEATNDDHYAPVLAYYDQAILPAEWELGQLKSSTVFADDLKSSLSNTKNLIILVVPDLITSPTIKQSLAKLIFSKNVVYEPQVESALDTLSSYADKNGIKVSLQKFDTFDDALVEFNQKLDKLASGTSLILTSGDDVEAANSRVKRAAEPTPDVNKAAAPSNRTYLFGTSCAAFFDSIKYSNDNSQISMLMDLPVDKDTSKFACDNRNETQTLSITLTNNTGIDGRPFTQLNLEFRLTNNSRYFEMTKGSIVLNDNSKLNVVYMGAPYSMETPIGYSFVCTRSVFLARNVSADGKVNQRISIFVNFLQLQALDMGINGTNYTFGTINYCQGFFSSGIWMAITSSLILAIILACGVSVLLQVNTMDRFDDPKGKPLNIGQEK